MAENSSAPKERNKHMLLINCIIRNGETGDICEELSADLHDMFEAHCFYETFREAIEAGNSVKVWKHVEEE